MEARLVKDIQPKYNRELRDDKSFPYLQITTHEDFPRVEVTREPRTSGVKLYGPFANAGSLRGAMQVLQKVFKFRTCSLDIEADDERWRWFRPCLLASINQCTAPCNLRISKEEYRKDIKRLRMFLEGNRKKLLAEMRQEMAEASAELQVRAGGPAARRNSTCSKASASAASSTSTSSPKCFTSTRKRASPACRRFSSSKRGRGTSKASTSPTSAATKRWPAWCSSSTACRSSRATAGIRIRDVEGVDDYASIREVVARRFRKLRDDGDVFPDILLIDGGIGQLRKALEAFQRAGDQAAARALARQERRAGLRR